jgi:phosphoribosylformylglycinamidine synthase
VDAIAGVCDATGLVLGMMPHPENHVTPRQGRAIVTESGLGSALPLFRNGVNAVR